VRLPWKQIVTNREVGRKARGQTNLQDIAFQPLTCTHLEQIDIEGTIIIHWWKFGGESTYLIE